MEPSSESTKLEDEGQAYEYRASGKLEGCKSLITGGEYVSHSRYLTSPIHLLIASI